MLTRGRAIQARTPSSPILDPAPLPRGYIDTGDLPMQQPPATRIDLNRRDPDVLSSLRRAEKPAGFAVGTPVADPSIVHLYVTLLRPGSCRNVDWASLVRRMDVVFASDWVTCRAATTLDDQRPAYIWAVSCPADLVAYTQKRAVDTIDLTFGARLIWAPAKAPTMFGSDH